MTMTEAQTAAPASPQAFKVERRTIEFIPENERYGRPRSLFYIWFVLRRSLPAPPEHVTALATKQGVIS